MYKLFILLLVVCMFPALADAQVDLTGYAWSSNIGWISFDGPGYGVTIQTNGNLTGYAWSSNIGWISFQQTSGCPGGTCRPRLNSTTDQLEGWARACAATANNDCTGALHSNGGGWDGWISLNCLNTGSCATNNYKVDIGGGTVSNFAWGGDVVGWIRMNPTIGVVYTPPCTESVVCSTDLTTREVTDEWCSVTNLPCPGGQQCDISNPSACVASNVVGSLSVAPRIVRQGGTVNMTWSSADTSSCTVTQANPGGVVANSFTGTSGSNVISSPIANLTVFTLECSDISGVNTYQVASTSVNILPQLIEI